MANPVVHFEIIGRNPAELRRFYKALFGWDADTDSAVAPQISDTGDYGFISPPVNGHPVAGGIGGGAAFQPRALFYVGVDDVEDALELAKSLGATTALAPSHNPNGKLVVGQFFDPEGNLIGAAGPR
ncbi:putative enzyme related to lactoylglutathione lyase [Okibacterium sp. HSC-33S16]|uniref:VOC family protein n=1 Tax=Okibacterium sp. HSC-33S16 TaxID=2910965 RepID=UPI0020A111AF|nr:VOC family protein [Okibacterium sp. HSC-33S16]MCP2032228.1 putative enzyme related to lactoylglutathione lyase [Okibacterium sp. HSC-33S16]